MGFIEGKKLRGRKISPDMNRKTSFLRADLLQKYKSDHSKSGQIPEGNIDVDGIVCLFTYGNDVLMYIIIYVRISEFLFLIILCSLSLSCIF